MSEGLLRNSASMAAGTVVSRVTGVLRDVMMTAALGFFIVADAYSLGNTLPNIIYILVAGGALNAVFIPQLVRHMKSDEDGGQAFADRLLSAVGILLVALSLVTVLLAPLIVDLYTPDSIGASEYELAVAFARLCLPQIFFYGAYTMLQQVLNARGKFAAAMFAPIANNIVAIVVFAGFIWAVRPTADSLSSLTAGQVWWLGLGTTLGVVAQAAVLLIPLARSGYRFHLRTDWRGSGLGHAGGLAVWTVGLVVANQIGYAVITRLATSANFAAAQVGATAAGLTTYQKAHLVFILPHSVIAVSLVTALLPRLSSLAHDRLHSQMGSELERASRVLLAVLVPVAALLAVTAPALTELLFGYGAAGLDAARLTGEVVRVFAVGLPAYSLVYVLYRAWYAMEDTRSPFVIAVVINLLNLAVALAWYPLAPLGSKIEVLAWSYTIAYTAAAVVAHLWLSRRLPGLRLSGTVGLTVRLLLAAAPGAAFGWYVMSLPLDGVFAKTAAVTLSWLAGLVLFIVAASAFRVTEVKEGLRLVLRRLPRRG